MRAEAISEPATLADATVATLIAQHVNVRPERPAFVMSNGDMMTYGALGAEITAFGTALRDNGIGRSAKVAILLPDGLELAVAIIAAACHSAALPLNPKITATELENLFARLRIDGIHPVKTALPN
jgi:acyl-CoA synthetase (AMP-forming)/AMP-acid ligase II